MAPASLANEKEGLESLLGLVGDAVNEAARLESLTKYFGVRLLLSRETFAQLRQQSTRRLVDRVIVKGKSVRSRLISPRETARLMGLPDTYELPSNYNEAYHLTGDGVAVPVVRHLAQFIFEPLLRAKGAAASRRAA